MEEHLFLQCSPERWLPAGRTQSEGTVWWRKLDLSSRSGGRCRWDPCGVPRCCTRTPGHSGRYPELDMEESFLPLGIIYGDQSRFRREKIAGGWFIYYYYCLYMTGLHPYSSAAQDTSKCKQWKNQLKFWINVHITCNFRSTIIILSSFLMYVFMNSRRMPILSINDVLCLCKNIGTRLVCRLTKQETKPDFCSTLIVVLLSNKPNDEDLQPFMVRLCSQELSTSRKWLPVLW